MIVSELVGLFFELQGILCFLFLIVFFRRINILKRFSKYLYLMIVEVICLSADIVTILLHGKPWDFVVPVTFITNGIQDLSIIVFILFMAEYLGELLQEYRKNLWIWVVRMLAAIIAAIVFTNPFHLRLYHIGSDHEYVRGPVMIPVMIAGLGVLLGISIVALINRQHLKVNIFYAVICVPVFPMIGLTFHLFHNGYCWIYIGMSISALSVLAVTLYNFYQEEKERDKKLAQERAYLLNSQIKPHFLFNSLNVIQSLIDIDPELAKEAIGKFAAYYRKSLNLDYSEGLISIWTEIDYVKNYLYIEQLRFGKKLQIVYQLDEDLDFEVPFLSVQPLVENAVKHGVRGKVEGGTVTIRTYQRDQFAIVEVEDDGIGFEVDKLGKNEKKSDSESGVGLQNVIERIQLLCEGNVKIISNQGSGTIISIQIPMREENKRFFKENR